MDPNATLDRIRQLLGRYMQDGLDGLEVGELVDHIEELDHWLSRGGFLPAVWNR